MTLGAWVGRRQETRADRRGHGQAIGRFPRVKDGSMCGRRRVWDRWQTAAGQMMGRTVGKWQGGRSCNCVKKIPGVRACVRQGFEGLLLAARLDYKEQGGFYTAGLL